MPEDKIVANQLKELALDEEQPDEFDASEASEDQFKAYMIKTFGEDSYKKGYAFVFNFRENIAEPATRKMVTNKLQGSNFGIENDEKAEKFIAISSTYILCNGL